MMMMVETVVIQNLGIHDVVLELPQGPVHLLGHPVRPHNDVACFKKKIKKEPQSTLPDYRRQALGSNKMSRNYDNSMNIVQNGGRDDKCYCPKGRSGIRGS